MSEYFLRQESYVYTNQELLRMRIKFFKLQFSFTLSDSSVVNILYISRLKLELEQCVQAMRDSEMRHEKHEDKKEVVDDDNDHDNMRRVMEERELLTQLTITRMTEKMNMLQEENTEMKRRLENNDHDIIDDVGDADLDEDVANHEIVLTQR